MPAITLKTVAAWVAASIALNLTLTAPAPAFAADAYPTRPIRIILLVVPGGGADITTRAVGQKLAEARAGDSRRRRPQSANGGPAGHRQDHARVAPAGHIAANDTAGGARIGGHAIAGQQRL